MAKWLPILPDHPLQEHYYQTKFWEALQTRLCPKCQQKFISPENLVCPTCFVKGNRQFHRLTLLSGRRGGKTRAGAIAAVKEALVPNTVGWVCAPTNDKLHRYDIRAFQQLIPPDWVRNWNVEHNDLWLKNGSLIHFQTLEKPDQGRGQGLHWLWIDEVCELTLEHWEVIRPSLTEHEGVAFFTSSPHGYDWVYRELYKRALERFPGYWATRYATKDNPIIKSSELAEAQATMSEGMYRQEYEADFVIFEGAVFAGLIESQILRNDLAVKRIIPEWPDINPTRQVIVGIDTGAKHPFGAVKLVSTEYGLVVVGEYLEQDKSFTQHAINLRRLAANEKAKFACNKNERQGMIELAQHHIYCQGSENDVVSGIERVKSWLHSQQLFFVASRCPRTIEQMSAYRWAHDEQRDGQLRKERVFKLDDELPDCIRYALMTWPVLPKVKPAEEKPTRDLSKLPADYRFTIELMRRHDARMEGKEAELVARGMGEDDFDAAEARWLEREQARKGISTRLGDDFWQ